MTPVQTISQLALPCHTHLLAALRLAELLVHRAVFAAQSTQEDEVEALPGLFVSDARAVEMLQRPFATPHWFANGHAADLSDWDWQIANQREAMADAGQLEASPLTCLVQRFELSRLEVDMLLLALLPEFDLRFERLYGYLHDDLTQKRPSIDLLLNVLQPSLLQKLSWRKLLLPNGRLCHTKLLNCTPPCGDPQAAVSRWVIRPVTHLAAFLLGELALDASLDGLAWLSEVGETAVSPHLADKSAHIQHLVQTLPHAPFFLLVGSPGAGRQQLAKASAAASDKPLLQVDGAALARQERPILSLLQMALRDGRLHGAMLLLTNWEALISQPAASPFWQAIASYPHPVCLSMSKPWQPTELLGQRPIFPITFPLPDEATRLTLWQRGAAELPQPTRLALPFIASQFRFAPRQIDNALATAVDLATWEETAVAPKHLLQACRQHSNQNLGQLATQIVPRYGWDDIVLAADTLAQLHEIVLRLRHQTTVFERWGYGQKLAYGKGLAALFIGESGTGKTMSADIIAGELGLDLYKIDLSSVVSKYIGETEKNLERIFHEATSSNAILFFDEADALFGKRGDVKDSHDRYANLEVSYLLQRIERFDGIAILASNLQANIDEAFVRRLSFIIEFPLPERAERAQIWRVSIPAATPVADDTDFDKLAEFKLTGGNIRSITLAAAFLAAAADEPLHMRHLLHATRREFQKLGRLFDESLFVEETAV